MIKLGAKKENESSGFIVDEKIGATLLDKHIFFLCGEINEENIKSVMQWLVFENLDNKSKILQLYINSEGGSLYDAFGLIDMMQSSTHPIRTIAVGTLMSAAFLIFSAGAKGERYIYKNTGIMCHQFYTGTDGKYHDIKAQAKENDYCNERMIKILQKASDLEIITIKKKLLQPSDAYFKAEELVDLGIADHII
jgi:ATP-dependent Clp protease protease subunit